MHASPIGSPERLKSLSDSDLTSDSFEQDLDALTSLITRVLKVPVALVSLVDDRRQFFKSYCGLPEPWASRRETPLSHSFCQHVVISASPLVVSDAREHPLLLDNLAIPDIGVIAYAGVPIVGADGLVLGSLCAIDSKPRDWLAEEVDMLLSFSLQVSTHAQLHARSRKLTTELADERRNAAEQQAMVRFNVHDLRTPLAALVSTMELVELLGPLTTDQEQILSIGKRNGKELIDLVNTLVAIGSVEQHGASALDRSAVQPGTLVQRALEQVRPLARTSGVVLGEHRPALLPEVLADPEKIVRVLVNLLGNAIKYNKVGGSVDVDLEATPEGMVRFTVRDTGIGITDVRDIFQEGVRLNGEGATAHSAGLGLNFCKRMVEAHGGSIGFDSGPAGSVFHFTLPTSAEQ